MKWNFGKIYKKIRKSKNISQSEICSDELSRSTLSKIENCKLMPSYQTMDYLLKQINMTFDEFNYLCNEYSPNLRDKLIHRIENVLQNYDEGELNSLINDCIKYLKTNNDLYLEEMLNVLLIDKRLKKSRDFDELSKELAKSIWKKIKKSEEWYFNDILLLNNILFIFPFPVINELTSKLLDQLEKYDNYKDSKDIICRLIINLSTIYLYNDDLEGCNHILEQYSDLIYSTKRFDYIAIFLVRHGIVIKNKNIVDKGISILSNFDENDLLMDLKKEVNIYY